MNALTQIDFHGDTIWAVRQGRVVLVPISPICRSLGIDDRSQRKRIERDDILREGRVIMTLPSVGGPQESVCLPLNLIPGWLFGIDTSRADISLRDKILDYKRECHAVLYYHFFVGPLAAPSAREEDDADDIEAPSGRRIGTHRWQAELALLRECRRLHGVKASRSLWLQLGLPVAWEGEATAIAASHSESVRRFLAEMIEPAPGEKVPFSFVYQSYKLWCGENGFAPEHFVRFGRAMREYCERSQSRGASKSNVVWYHGIRIRPTAQEAPA